MEKPRSRRVSQLGSQEERRCILSLPGLQGDCCSSVAGAGGQKKNAGIGKGLWYP
jgi:hypothetical protein